MAFTSKLTSFLLVSGRLSLLVAAQSQSVQFNQVINLNGDMQLNSLQFPDNSKIETFSQTQRQIIVNQNPNPLPANNVVGSTGQPFVQLSANSMTIQTNKATDLVGGQIEMSIDPAILQQNGVSAGNTFVAQLSNDRQAWIITEGVKSVNTTDNTVRMVKMNSIDGEFMAVGRQTVETSQVLTTFNQNQQVNIAGSGIQEVEFTDGFRMSIRASQPMTMKTDVVNGVSASMMTGGTTSVNNFRYLVTTNLAGVQPNLNSMVAVVQLPINAARIMSMAQAMGATANGSVSLGVAQRAVLQNPGGSSVLQQPQKRRASSVTSASAASAASAAPDASVASDASAATDSTAAATTGGATSAAADPAASTASSTQTTSATQQQNTPPPSQTQAQLPAATQLLLSPTFTPLTGQPLLDSKNNRIAVPVSQIDGEFIITMGMAGSAGQLQVNPAVTSTPGAGIATPGAFTAGAAQPTAQAQGGAGAGQLGQPAQGQAAKRQAPAPGGIIMTMAQLADMVQRQANGGVTPVWNMMSEFVAQQATGSQGTAAKRMEGSGRRIATPLRV
ncbi:hypothetical protein BJ170DRAFT_683064 [Xylariales sp. AK1849]|nr:hypothetical protein BJ170DRAFT_683064 [Xylariales sp. AK1849]